MDSGLNNAAAVNFLKKNDLPLISNIKNKNYRIIKLYQKRADSLLSDYRDSLINKAEFKVKRGVNKAVPKNKNPREETMKEIAYYNILGDYVNNINKLENIAKKTGQGIIHFSSPHQLLDRLELLIGSLEIME